MAEGVGFEPTDPYGSPVFKTGALNRSAIPPIGSSAWFANFPLFGRFGFRQTFKELANSTEGLRTYVAHCQMRIIRVTPCVDGIKTDGKRKPIRSCRRNEN
jgi:hypothetical protein